MPQSFEDRIRDTLGNQQMMILQLQTQVDVLTAKVVELTPPPADPPAPEGGT